MTGGGGGGPPPPSRHGRSVKNSAEGRIFYRPPSVREGDSYRPTYQTKYAQITAHKVKNEQENQKISRLRRDISYRLSVKSIFTVQLIGLSMHQFPPIK